MPPVSGAYEYSLGGKWLELLTQIAPGVTRIAVIRDASLTSGTGQFAAIQSAASAFRVELRAVGVEDAGEIDRGVTAFAHSPNGGLIVPGSALATRHRDLIITLAARHKLPALYFDRAFVAAGGLMSYGPVQIDLYRQAASYVDRILKGEKPADLPVPHPTKYELVINLQTARALGLTCRHAARPRRRGDRMMRRREFITLIGGAAYRWPFAARAQQPSMPVIGFLASGSPPLERRSDHNLAAFRTGVEEAGFVEGKDVIIDYKWARGQFDRLPTLASELVARPVDVIFAFGTPIPARAAKAATSTIPIVFAYGGDPVADGLVASLNRPGGNVTGATFITAALAAKRLELLRELVPNADTVGVLVNPKNQLADTQLKDADAASRSLGQPMHIAYASSENEFEAAFTALARQGVRALLLGTDTIFFNRRDQLIALAASHRIPAIYTFREYVRDGGLISYGPIQTETIRQAGLYAGRILKGAKPADLPVLQPTKFELVINLKTATALGLEVPWFLQQRADEVIE